MGTAVKEFVGKSGYVFTPLDNGSTKTEKPVWRYESPKEVWNLYLDGRYSIGYSDGAVLTSGASPLTHAFVETLTKWTPPKYVSTRRYLRGTLRDAVAARWNSILWALARLIAPKGWID